MAIDDIIIITTRDISEPMGSTEPYYISKKFGQNFNTHLYGPLSKPISGVNCTSLPFNGFFGVILLNFLLIPYWSYISMKLKPDVIYAYQEVIVPPFIIGKLSGANIVYDLQSDPYEQGAEFASKGERSRIFIQLMKMSGFAHTFALQNADCIITLSDGLKESLLTNYDIKENKIHIVPLGVDPQVFKPIENTSEKSVIVYMGTVNKMREIHTVIDAIAEIEDQVQAEIVFRVLGGGDDRYIRELESRAKSSLTTAEFDFVGKIPHEAIPEEVGKCDIAISPLPPMKAYQVSSPAKLFEYLALGLPIIASRIRPHEQYLENGVNSLLFDDEYGLSENIQRLLSDSSLRKSMGRNARDQSMNHTWEQRFESILEAINQE